MKLEKRLLIMAVLGGEISLNHKGFKQKDVRFYAELFSNWIDVLLLPSPPQWHNTQALRFLDELVKQGWARGKNKGKKKTYHLSRVGLLELVQSLTQIEGYGDFRHVILVFYFLKSYKERTIQLIEREGSGFSKVVQLEIQHLFDSQRFLKKQIDSLQLQITRMKARISETKAASQMATKLHRQGEPHNGIVEKVSRMYPYELDHQKPMVELFKEIAPEQQLWELSEGNHFRHTLLWTPQLKVLESYLQIYKELAERRPFGSKDL